MRRLTTVLVLVLAGPAFAQDDMPADPAGETPREPANPGAVLPAAETLFEKHVEAIGGWDAVNSIKNRHIKGRIRGPKPDGGTFLARVEIWGAPPDLHRMVITAPGQGTVETYYDGEYGWKQFRDSYLLITGTELSDLQLSADFIGEANYKNRYAELETMDRVEPEDASPVYRVRYVANNGKRGALVFDEASGLLVGSVTTMTVPQGQMQTIVTVDKYKDFGGMFWPTEIRQVTPVGETVITFREVEVNLPDDKMEVFDRPSEIDRLAAEHEKQAVEQSETQEAPGDTPPE